MLAPMDHLSKTLTCAFCGFVDELTAERCSRCDRPFLRNTKPAIETLGRTCPYCNQIINPAAFQCRFCGERLTPRDSSISWLLPAAVMLSCIAAILFCGLFRIYSGTPIPFIQIAPKESFSFTDTFVNLDSIFGQPRIVVAEQHPAVKRQLEEMGLVETDEVAERQATEEFNRSSKREEIDRIRRSH